MNDNVSLMWHQAHDSGLGDGASDMNDDFSNFLNFGDMPMGLTPAFDPNASGGGDSLAMDTDFCLDGNNSHNTRGNESGMPAVTQAELMDIQFHEMQKSMEQAQMMSRQHGMHHHHHHHGMIPPTPSSMEMHAGLPQTTLHNIHPQMMMDRYSMYREEPMIFTPLVSPAVTPLDTEYSRQIPDFAMPGAFSPLTSPALDAHQHRTHMPNPHMSHNANQMPTHVEPGQSPITGRKSSCSNASGGRRRSVTSRTPARVVRESPSMKPQRKRPPPQLAAAPLLASALAQQAQTSYPPPLTMPQSARRNSSTPVTSRHNTPTQQPTSRGSSSNESVSPEPLPEVLMAPPPRKTSIAKEEGTGAQGSFSAPMTPATLMRLPPTSVHSDDTPPISMDTAEYLNREVEVTDASKASMNGSENGDEMPTPTMPAPNSRTPSLTPSLKPSASSSVQTSRHTSPLDPVNSGAITKKEPARIRKRGSVSSSPALQPKISQISPSIKPLLPQGMSPDASAFLLASKSNYQNIVEGNHSHLGLQYPEHLSTNLTSKRTSHKIAEQGRRNRINNALAEMASLLPTPSASGESAPGKEQTSKASTVELAIEYIRQLKTELQDTKKRLTDAEKKVEQCGGCDGSNAKAKDEMEGMEKTVATMSSGSSEAETAVSSPGVAVSA